MKARKRLLLRLLCLALAVATINGVFAQHVSRETARSVAETFFSQNVRNGKGEPVQFEDITAETPFQNFYIFSAASGFVLVAADERVTPILGYSKTSRFVTEDMPENLRWWLEGYDGQIQVIKDNAVPATSEINADWKDLKAGEMMPAKGNRGKVLNLTTKWDQQDIYNNCVLYNNLCPPQAGPNHTLTGCTATAMAQVMKYWEWPVIGSGSHSYTLKNYGIQSAVFDTTHYNWAKMPNKLSCSSGQDSINAVATLMYHCGVAVNMDYGYSVSNAPFVPSSMVDFFDYSVAVEDALQNNYSDEEWISMLKHEIDFDRPVLYGGHYISNGGSPGHAFVCYGYDNNNMFKFNWGWSGNHDGENEYWAIGNLNPQSGGSGSGSGPYNLNCECLFYLMPVDRNLNAPISLTVNNTGGNALQLEWSPAQYAGSYLILKNGHYLAETTLNSYLDTGVYGGSNTYQIITVGENHRASLPSGNVTYTKPYESPVPTALSASATGTSVELSWDAPSNTAVSLYHHKTPYDDTELERVGGKRFNNVCYEVFRPSETAQYSNRYVTSIGYRISTRMVGTLHYIRVYKGNFPGNGTLMSSHEYFPNASGIYYDHLSSPFRIEGNEDTF